MESAKKILESLLAFNLTEGTNDWIFEKNKECWLVLATSGNIRIVKNEIKSAKTVSNSDFYNHVLNLEKKLNLFRITDATRIEQASTYITEIATFCFDNNINIYFRPSDAPRELCTSIDDVVAKAVDRRYGILMYDYGVNIKKRYFVISERPLSNYYSLESREFMGKILQLKQN